MKIGERTSISTPTKRITIEREDGGSVSITVRALPVDAQGTLSVMFAEAPKPHEMIYGQNGLPLRDPKTNKVLTQEVETDQWRARDHETTNARMGYIVYHGIDDPDVNFTSNGNNREHYLAVFQELVDFGFTLGDILKITSEIMELMNLDKDIEEATEGF